MKLPGKIILIKEALLTDIRNGLIKPNEKIPSRSSCMTRFSCARASIDRAISELIEAGFLYSRQGSGTFVSPPLSQTPEISKLYIVGLFGHHDEFSFFKGSIETSLRDAISIPIRLLDWSKLSVNLEKLATPGNAVIWKYPRYQELTAMQFLCKAGIPQLLIGRDYEPYNFITTDARFGIDKGLDILCAAANTKRLGFIHSPGELERHYIAERQLIFYSLLFHKELQLPSRFIICADRHPHEPDTMRRAARQLLGGEDPCQAIYMDYSLWYEDFIRAAAEMNKFPGRDFILLTFDRPLTAALPHGVITIRQDYGKAAAIIKKWLDKRGQQNVKLRLKPIIKSH